MARAVRPAKLLIYAFYEGESEKEYLNFLKMEFEEIAVINVSAAPGIFPYPLNKFRKSPGHKDAIDAIDEIWLFFDVEDCDCSKCDELFSYVVKLQKLRPRHRIPVRLLMTKACVEYWFLLHYKKTAPPISTVPDKNSILKQLQGQVPNYKKGDPAAISKIGTNYLTAVDNGTQVLKALLEDGMPALENNENRNKWLYRSGLTFTTVQEAIQLLLNRKNAL